MVERIRVSLEVRSKGEFLLKYMYTFEELYIVVKP
jgi:hypothetical protein